MRLLNRKSEKIEFFPDRPYPRYAILSHTWGATGTEITFRDMMEGTQKLKEASYSKLTNTCARAEADDIDYVWIDNFCIDKESSAELSESINSMFTWYKDAEICYAFLADVPSGEDPVTSEAFAESNWFKRGWTLQELIAPRKLEFYSQDWEPLGTRSELASTIAQITRIDEPILTGLQDLKYVSVAKRMSWASDRKTTRQEDMAYCLMGLFDVNMAMLYGEGGEKAFRRLQEEIMKDSDDETLFAWTNMQKDQPELHGLLAKSPQDFRHSSNYIPDYGSGVRKPYSNTSRGLRITLGLQRLKGDVWIGSLECPVPPAYKETLAIYLRVLDKEGQQYARINCDRLCKIPERGPPQTIYVRQNPLIPGYDDICLHHVFQLRKASVIPKGVPGPCTLEDRGYCLADVLMHPLSKSIEPLPTIAPEGLPLLTIEIQRGSTHLAGVLVFQRPDGINIFVMLGSKPGLGIGAQVVLTEDVNTAIYKPKRSSFANQFSLDPVHTPEQYFEEIEKRFNPQGLDTWFDLGDDQFHVDVKPIHHAGIRYYMVDLTIKETPSILAEVEDLMDMKDLKINGKRKWRERFKGA